VSPARLTAWILFSAFLWPGHATAEDEARTRNRVEKKYVDLADAWKQRLQGKVAPLASIPLTDDEKAAATRVLAQAADRARRGNAVSAAADAVDAQATSATTVERLAAALKTNPEGTEAGVALAPFVLAGSCTLTGLELQLAALKDDVVRAGVSYTWDRTPPLREAWRDPAQCPAPKDAELDELLVPAHAFFLDACLTVLANPAALGNAGQLLPVQAGQVACGHTPAAGAPAIPPFASLGEAIEQVASAIAIVAKTEDVSPATRSQAIRLGPQAIPFEAWEPRATCHDAKFVEARFEQLYWSQPRTKIALAATVDRFSKKFGFSPDGSELSGGQVGTWTVSLAFSHTRSGVEWGFGAGIGQSRAAFADKLATTVSPSFSVAKAFTLLSSKPLRDKDGGYNVDKDGAPPHLVLGLSTAVEIATDPPAIRTTRWNSVKVQPYLDFFVTDKLSFRLGIPIKGAIVERKEKVKDLTATPPVPETVPGQKSLQWTVPVSLVTVLKL